MIIYVNTGVFACTRTTLSQSQQRDFPFLKAETQLRFNKETTAAENRVSPFKSPKKTNFFLRGDRFSFQFRCRCTASTPCTGACVSNDACVHTHWDDNNNNKNNNFNNNKTGNCQENQKMSLWLAERKYLKFKPCTLLCALPQRQLPPCLAFIALVLPELFYRTGIKLMGTIGTSGTRRSQAAFGHQHSQFVCTGWFGCSSWGGHSRGVPPLHPGPPGRCSSFGANLSPGRGDIWGSPLPSKGGTAHVHPGRDLAASPRKPVGRSAIPPRLLPALPPTHGHPSHGLAPAAAAAVIY